MESARPDAREAAERASSARRRICHRRLALEAPRAGADDCGGAGGGEGEGEEDPMGRVPEMSASVTLRTGRGRWPYCSGWTEPHVHPFDQTSFGPVCSACAPARLVNFMIKSVCHRLKS
jgi:hypothetical protein